MKIFEKILENFLDILNMEIKFQYSNKKIFKKFIIKF